MNIYSGTYNGQVFMLSGHPTNFSVKRRNQISQTSIRALYLPENSQQILSGGFDGEVIAINKYNLQSTKQTKQPKGIINCLSRVNDTVIAVGHQNGIVRFWDWKSWNLKKQLRQHKKPVKDFCIDNQGVLFFSAANNGLVLWNPTKYQKVFNYKFNYQIDHVLISQSLEYILLLNQKQLHQINAKTNEQVAVFKIMTPTSAEMIQTAIIYQNYVIIGGDKGNIFIYALGQYEHKISFQAHKLRVKCMKVVHYDEMDYLVTASSSGEISTWDVLEFLKQVQKIGQDYNLEGLQPLCTVDLDRRVICIQVGLIEEGIDKRQINNSQKQKPVQKNLKKQKKNQNNKQKNVDVAPKVEQKPTGKKLPKQQIVTEKNTANSTQNSAIDIKKQKKIQKKKRRLELAKKLKFQQMKKSKQNK